MRFYFRFFLSLALNMVHLFRTSPGLSCSETNKTFLFCFHFDHAKKSTIETWMKWNEMKLRKVKLFTSHNAIWTIKCHSALSSWDDYKALFQLFLHFNYSAVHLFRLALENAIASDTLTWPPDGIHCRIWTSFETNMSLHTSLLFFHNFKVNYLTLKHMQHR